jgi:transcriptional regulator with XRE-family HTH domain
MDRVEQALKGSNYTQIAKRSGTTPAYICLLFNRRRSGKTDTLKKVAVAIGVTLDELHTYLSKTPLEKRAWQKKPATPKVKAKGRSKAPTTAAA